MRSSGIRADDEHVFEFTWGELSVLLANLIEAAQVVPRSDYLSHFGLDWRAADELFWQLKPSASRLDPRRNEADRPAGLREVDGLAPESREFDAARVRLSDQELVLLLRAAELVQLKLSGTPVDEAEYRARVGIDVSEARVIVADLATLILSVTGNGG